MLLWPPPGSKFSVPPFAHMSPIVPHAKMLLWPPPGSIFRSMAWHNEHCYHQNHQKTTVIISIIGIPDFCSSSSNYIFVQTTQVIQGILGVPGFVRVRLSLIFFIFPMEKHIFCNCCYFVCAIFFTTISILVKKQQRNINISRSPFLVVRIHVPLVPYKTQTNDKDFHQNWKQFFLSFAPICMFVQKRK